jgi:catechol 2,3-dioxygenase-like lactoylglutathione lyase family enzyme
MTISVHTSQYLYFVALCYTKNMKVRHIDHIGINVLDLDAAKAFFTDLGFTIAGESSMEGELLDKVIGLKNAQTEFVMLQAPDGQLNIEVIKYHHPVDSEGIRVLPANTLGMRHLCFEVDDVEEIIASLKQKGHELVGELQTYENVWKLCYIRGPEGIIVELAERL